MNYGLDKAQDLEFEEHGSQIDAFIKTNALTIVGTCVMMFLVVYIYI